MRKCVEFVEWRSLLRPHALRLTLPQQRIAETSDHKAGHGIAVSPAF